MVGLQVVVPAFGAVFHLGTAVGSTTGHAHGIKVAPQ